MAIKRPGLTPDTLEVTMLRQASLISGSFSRNSRGRPPSHPSLPKAEGAEGVKWGSGGGKGQGQAGGRARCKVLLELSCEFSLELHHLLRTRQLGASGALGSSKWKKIELTTAAQPQVSLTEETGGSLEENGHVGKQPTQVWSGTGPA
ncbi:hypothetical protein D4764_13G0002840 [Takifugu flavidus]|uniref:Uncharacterized protein n=1 Tax=Takifugu flavidus TaxID=433684 RepID=A0A5C6P7G0_9TELE|nr:hypothetical protein D4764_13G0002840 [Takifugu flavidus]